MGIQIANLSIELIIGFFALLISTKLLGKTQITQLTPFDFISALVLGELVGNAIYDPEVYVHFVIYAVGLWVALILLVEFFTQKIKKTRHILEGKPSIVIRKGQLDYQSLKKNKLDLNQLQHLLRDKDIFSIQEVEYAVLESNGNINVIKKDEAATPSRSDLGIQSSPQQIPLALILDGEWVEDNLLEARLTKQEVKKELARLGIPHHRRVLYAEYNGTFPLYVQTYEEDQPAFDQ